MERSKRDKKKDKIYSLRRKKKTSTRKFNTGSIIVLKKIRKGLMGNRINGVVS